MKIFQILAWLLIFFVLLIVPPTFAQTSEQKSQEEAQASLEQLNEVHSAAEIKRLDELYIKLQSKEDQPESETSLEGLCKIAELDE